MNLRKNLRFIPIQLGKPVSRVEMNAKNAPLTPASPQRRLSTQFLRPRAVKIALTKPTMSYTANVCPFLGGVEYSASQGRSGYIYANPTIRGKARIPALLGALCNARWIPGIRGSHEPNSSAR